MSTISSFNPKISTNPFEPNDANLKSWVPVAAESDFSVQNLPFGIFSVGSGSARMGVAIGEKILDLKCCAEFGYFNKLNFEPSVLAVFSRGDLNAFMELGKPTWRKVRAAVSQLLRLGALSVEDQSQVSDKALVQQSDAKMHLPIKVAGYVDFYSSEEHATNVGKMVRDPNNPLLPNWKHIPIGYNGRANTVVVSGTDFHRPVGQVKPPTAELPEFVACRNLDFELEVGTIVGQSTAFGSHVSCDAAEDLVFGLVLLNDWSARDIQTWEYQPLGPFLAKTFCTSISPWVVSIDALEPFRVAGPKHNPPLLPYLTHEGFKNFDIKLQAHIKSKSMALPLTICQTNFKAMYFNLFQQIAHLTSNGTPLSVGDTLGSGTVSGSTPESFGSMLELCWKGTTPMTLPDGTQRSFLQDGDELILTGYGEHHGVRVGFGKCSGKVLAAKVT